MAASKSKTDSADPSKEDGEGGFRPGEMVVDIAVREGALLARRAVQRNLARAGVTGKRAGRFASGEGFTKRLAAATLAHLAARSVPGTILVGGGLLAKALYELRKSRKAPEDGAEIAGAEPAAENPTVEAGGK